MQLPHHAANILACGDGREPSVNMAMDVITADGSQLLDRLLQPGPSTPPVLLLAAAEKNEGYKKLGDQLAANLEAALQQGGVNSMHQFLEASAAMVDQLTVGKRVTIPASTAAAAGASHDSMAAQLIGQAYQLLKKRLALQVKYIAFYAMHAVRRAQHAQQEQQQHKLLLQVPVQQQQQPPQHKLLLQVPVQQQQGQQRQQHGEQQPQQQQEQYWLVLRMHLMKAW